MKLLNTINELHEFLQIEPNKHPLITVNNLSSYGDSYIKAGKQTYKTQFFLIHLIQAEFDGVIRLGNIPLDSTPNHLTFSPAGRIINFEPTPKDIIRKGWGLYIDPEFLLKHPLGRKINSYPFFAFDFLDSIPMSNQELETTVQLFKMIKIEVDKTEETINEFLVFKLLDVFFEYINKFAENKNFRTLGNDIYYQFNQKIVNYIHSDKPAINGFPSVKLFAEELNISENYLRKQIKSFSGKTPSELIQDCIIAFSKHELITGSESILQISINLGFNNQSSFTKYFKNVMNISPLQYRNQHT